MPRACWRSTSLRWLAWLFHRSPVPSSSQSNITSRRRSRMDSAERKRGNQTTVREVKLRARKFSIRSMSSAASVLLFIEGVVDDEAPGAGAGTEVLVREPACVADVAEDQVDLAPASRARRRDAGRRPGMSGVAEFQAEAFGDQACDQLAAAPVVVLALGPLDDRLVVHVGQLHPDDRVAVSQSTWISGTSRAQSRTLASTMSASPPGSGDDDRAVVERGQPGRGQRLQRGHVGGDRGEQQGLGEPVVGAECGRSAGTDPAGRRRSRWWVESSGRSFSWYSLVAERKSAAACASSAWPRPALDDVVEGVADRDDVVDASACSRRSTSICCMTFSAVRSRCMTLARERRVETRAGEKGRSAGRPSRPRRGAGRRC